jgi:hypothetical protein
LSRAIGLEEIGKYSFSGFGGKRKFRSKLVNGQIELANIKHEVTFASIGDAHFPSGAPTIVLGRNLLNLFKITLDGPNKKIVIQGPVDSP